MTEIGIHSQAFTISIDGEIADVELLSAPADAMRQRASSARNQPQGG
jgi:hypothetical protein